jgi:hypothetical protein
MSNYVGMNPDLIYAAITDRFFYGLRRTDQGELFIGKTDLAKKDSSISINNPGDPVDNYPNFQEGQDFFEGRDTTHNIVYKNLNYEQFRWDNKNIYYYINDEGELVARINQSFVYDESSSSEGLE